MTEERSSSKGKANSPFSPINILTGVILLLGALFFLKPISEPNSTSDPEVLFTLGGKEYRYQDLPLRVSQPLYQSELNNFRVKERLMAAAIVHHYIEQQMEQTGESRDTVVQRLFQPAPPSDEDIAAFYDQNKSLIKVPLEQAKQEISVLIATAEQQRKEQELLAKLLSLNELSWNMEQPKAPFVALETDGFPSKGPADATVTFVEFADYQCPHCKTAHQRLAGILPKYLDRVRYVYMDFPINRSGISRKIAEAAVCADQQGKYWQYHDQAFAQQETLTLASALGIAEQLELDMAAFQSCFQDKQTAEKVRQSEQQAIQAGLTGTPSFFLNGKKLVLRNFERDLTQQLEEALQISQQ